MRSLQAKVFLIFALIATLPLAAMSYLAVTETRESFREEVGRAHQGNAMTAAAFVTLYVDNARLLLGQEAQSTALHDALVESNAAAAQREIELFHARNVYQGRAIYASVLLLDADGRLTAASPPDRFALGTDMSQTAAFLVGRGASGVATLPIVGGPDPTLPMTSAVDLGAERGVLVTQLHFDALSNALQAFTSRTEEAVFVVDGTGLLLVHANTTLVSEQIRWRDAPPVAHALDGANGYAEFDDPATGERLLGGHAPVQTMGWVVVTTQPVGVAYEGIGRLTAVLLVLAADLIIAMLLASVVVAQRVVKPVRDLTGAAHAVAAGNLSARIRTQGSDEIAELGRAFNTMAERLTVNVEDIRRSEARYRSLVESANDMIFTIEHDGTLSFVSRLSETLLGSSPGELTGRPAGERVHPDDRFVFEAAATSVMITGEGVTGLRHRLVHRAGGERHVVTNLTPILTHRGVPGRVLGVSRDVTQARVQEFVREKGMEMARLVSEETELGPLCERGLDILQAVSGLQWGSLLVRQAARFECVASQGVPFAAAVERLADDVDEFVPPEMQRQGARTVLRLPLIERSERVGLAVLFGAEGSMLDASTREALDGLSAQLAVGIRRSLFEARLKEYAAELEAKVEMRTALLQEKSAEIESFLYSVSHDLKAPLISIGGYAQALDEEVGPRLSEDAAHFIQRIRDNADVMESLIQDILELSRIGRVREDVGPVDSAALLHSIVHRLGDDYATAGGKATLEGDFPVVLSERKRLDQLFSNLLGNALKYRHPERSPRVKVAANVADEKVVFTVQDNGRGFPEGAHGKAFSIFQRFPSTDMPDPGGTGIGLAIVKRIVDLHGGRIWFESQPGKGTTFYVELPLEARSLTPEI